MLTLLKFPYEPKQKPATILIDNPVHKIRNHLCVIQLAIQINAAPETIIQAVQQILDILGPLESILKEREVHH